MQFRTVLAAFALLVIGVFFVINRQVLAVPATFNFLITSVDTSLGAVMLAITAGILAVVAVYVALWHRSLLVDYRRQAQELQLQRTLAESAEASRFTEIGRLVHEDIAALSARMDTALEGVRAELRATENSISASLGEMDDRLRRGPLPELSS